MSNQPRHELLLVAETVAREKGIEREDVIFAMEQAIQKAAKAKYGVERDIRALIDRTTGEVDIEKCLTVVDEVQNSSTEISLKDAKERNSKAAVGDLITEMLPPIEFGRVAAQSARQVIFQKVRDAEGFSTIEEIAYVPLSEFSNIEGFDDEISQELQNRAVTYLSQRDVKIHEECKELGLTQEVMDIDGLTAEMLLKLAKNGIKSLDDFADLATDELLDIIGKSALSLDQANTMIMAARSHWFADTQDSKPD